MRFRYEKSTSFCLHPIMIQALRDTAALKYTNSYTRLFKFKLNMCY